MVFRVSAVGAVGAARKDCIVLHTIMWYNVSVKDRAEKPGPFSLRRYRRHWRGGRAGTYRTGRIERLWQYIHAPDASA